MSEKFRCFFAPTVWRPESELGSGHHMENVSASQHRQGTGCSWASEDCTFLGKAIP